MGTEEFYVPALLALASAGTQYANQANATSRANAAQVQNIQEQEAQQQKANSQVGALTKQISQNSPQTLADELTGEFVSNLRKNAAGAPTGAGTTAAPINFGQSTSALPSNVNGNQRYSTNVANAQNQVENYGNQEARLAGNIGAPTLLRQNEGLGMETLGTNLNLAGAQSYTQNFVNQLRSNAGGVQSPWLGLLSSGLSGASNTLSKNLGPSGTPPLYTSQYSPSNEVTGGNVDVVSG